MTDSLLEYLKRMQAIAKTGLTYAADPYDQERYQEMRDRTHQLLAEISGWTIDSLQVQFDSLDNNYPTPKVDVRAWVMEQGKILMVQEQADGCWALPGGWCDIGFSPADNIVKEVAEETGLSVQVERLMALWDKRKHDHPPAISSVYKVFFHCQKTGGDINPGHDVQDAGFFSLDQLPALSTSRITESQIRRLARWNWQRDPVLFDLPEPQTQGSP